MKKINTLLVAATTVVFASCSSPETEVEEQVIESVEYSLDTEASTLAWAANMSPEYGHNGTISIVEGTLTMSGDEIESGTFTIDMTSIKNSDIREAGEDGKAAALEGHLMGTIVDGDHPVDLFFNTPSYSTATVTLGEYKDGKLGVTLSMLGKEVSQDVEVSLTHDEHGANIKGDFAFDFDALKIPGLQPDSESGAQINPNIDFKLNIVLTK